MNIPSSLYSYIVSEFLSTRAAGSWHYSDMPSYEDVATILESVAKWAAQSGKITEDGKISLVDIIDK